MRSRIARLILVSIMISGSVAAQEKSFTPVATGLIHLKEAIDSNYFDATRYRFSGIVLEAAGAGNEKDEEVVRRKVGLMWQQLLFTPICADSSLRLVNVLPYAFSKPYQRLMLIVAKGWELDLNFFDTDQRTMLDHLDEAIAAAPNEARANMLKEYRDIYTEAGAKRRADLSFYVKNLTSRFDAVRPYAYGLFPVMKKAKWGWVNEKGVPVIPLQYKAVRYFVKDVFEVSDDGVHFYYVDRKNQRIKSPWEIAVKVEPWLGQSKQKKVVDIDGNETTAYLTLDTLRKSVYVPGERPSFINWLAAGADLVGFGYRDRHGNSYGPWKYYLDSANRWELFCEGYYTTVQESSLQVDEDIAKQFTRSASPEVKTEFIKELKDRLLFTGEWRFYREGRLDRIFVLDDKVTIPYSISQSMEGTITLLRLVVERRMAGTIVTACQLSSNGHMKKMITKELTIEFDNNGKPVFAPLPDLE